LFDEATRRNFFQIIPKPVYGVSIDQSGLILTSTKDQDGYLKLNIANVIFNQSVWGFETVEDLAVGPYNTIYTLTSEGYIVEYDPNGSVLFLFSGPDAIGQKGLFKQAKGIAVDSRNNLYAVDEATSSLDGKSEADISDSINEFRGEVTTIVIAHRLSTIRTADKVIYMNKGRIEFIGTFEEVRKNVPEFDKQAKLMGL
jgi:hypothetical protein